MAIASRLISRLQQRTQELKEQKRTLQSETEALQYETEMLQSETELLQTEKQALQRETEKLRKTNSNLQSLLYEIESRQSKIPPKEVHTLRSLLSSSNQTITDLDLRTPDYIPCSGDLSPGNAQLLYSRISADEALTQALFLQALHDPSGTLSRIVEIGTALKLPVSIVEVRDLMKSLSTKAIEEDMSAHYKHHSMRMLHQQAEDGEPIGLTAELDPEADSQGPKLDSISLL
jgi:myosin heavy subunit